MLPDTHPDAWNMHRAIDHMPAEARKQRLLDGGNLVVTEDLVFAVEVTRLALMDGETVAVSGPSGTGKSTLLTALAAVATVRVAMVRMAPSTNNGVDQWQAIAKAVTGAHCEGSRAQLQDITRAYLSANAVLMVVDEAHLIGRQALYQLRWLFENPFEGSALILAGSNLEEYLEQTEDLKTRVHYRVFTDSDGPKQFEAHVRASHPVAAGISPDLFKQIDDAYGVGRWRNWAGILKTLDRIHTGAPGSPIPHATASWAVRMKSGFPLPAPGAAPVARRRTAKRAPSRRQRAR